ncbi:DNA-deoxyinosine glycosylase [Arenimonas sp.]|uniref:DNA-deoxyinosine glycosylase n=1 Tax=Arenimonas sp. TaxID=1872635 RepID=UPI0039E5CE7E
MQLHTVPAVRHALASMPPSLRLRPSSFAPVCDPRAQTLILGSMPGIEALRVREYYAHASDSFWKIMGALYGAGPCLPYELRLRILKQNRIALWDVVQSCDRTAYAGAPVAKDGRVPNDIAAFLRTHPGIRRIYFNGAVAARLFDSLIADRLDGLHLDIALQPLPSTSPANASLRHSQKLVAWSVLRDRAQH